VPKPLQPWPDRTLVRLTSAGDHLVVWTPKREKPATLDDVVELLGGIGRELMVISATLEEIARYLREDDEED
jgi:hypothetical protein